MSDKENALMAYNDIDEEYLDFDQLVYKLEAGLEESIADFKLLDEEKAKIGNPDSLGKAVMDVVWDQFIIQIGNVAGEDFVKENRGLRLDLSDEAHVQSVDNFEEQEYATHNTYVDYEKRGEEYRSNFYTDPDEKPKAKQKQEQRYNEKTKVWETYDNVDGEWKKTLREDYRKPYEEDRRKDKNKLGNKTIHKDHQVAAGTIARDPEAGTYMTLDEKVKVANSTDNLHDLDSAANTSKSDHDGEKWIKQKRTGKNGNGQTNADYFGIDENEYIEKDKASKEAYREEKHKKKEEEIALGKKSQKDEAFRVSGKALRAAVMGLLAELIRNIIGKLIIWLKSKEKSLETFVGQIKEAISAFLKNIKQNLLTAGTTIGSTVLTAIYGPIVRTMQMIWNMLKQGGKSVIEAIKYIKDPKNKGKSFGVMMMEIGKIVVAGLTAAGAIVLGEVIEKALLPIPVFAIEIPLIGSLANIIGIFLGAVVAGIAGALVLNLIDKMIANSKNRELRAKQIDKGNEVLRTQEMLIAVSEAKVKKTKKDVAKSIGDRHKKAEVIIREASEEIFKESKDNDNQKKLSDLRIMLSKI